MDHRNKHDPHIAANNTQQPIVDFASASVFAKRTVAFQDASVLCLHAQDVGNTVSALAVANYGEAVTMEEDGNGSTRDYAGTDGTDGTPHDRTKMDATTTTSNNQAPQLTSATSAPADDSSATSRGHRSWRDPTGGEGSVSLCCSRCCAPLGFASLASPETWRFWKHRLSAVYSIHEPPPMEESKFGFDRSLLPRSSVTMTSSSPPPNRIGPPKERTKLTERRLGSCSSFLARELVRYAESKAIFTFVVQCERAKTKENDKQAHRENVKCLLLRLLSWETTMATSFHDSKSPPSLNFPKVKFEKVARIVFEEAVDPATVIKGPHDDASTASQQWIWGGVDLCCPPNVSKSSIGTPTTEMSEGRVSTVRLQLPSDEYLTVMQDLQSGIHLFGNDVAKATMLLKMGGISDGVSLSALLI
jgi:HECT-like Ubiquitin-conjugating enzyme (E2)-binding